MSLSSHLSEDTPGYFESPALPLAHLAPNSFDAIPSLYDCEILDRYLSSPSTEYNSLHDGSNSMSLTTPRKDLCIRCGIVKCPCKVQ